MPRPKNKFPKKEKTHFQRTVSLKLRERKKDWIWLSEKISDIDLSESFFRSVMNGTKTPSLDLVFQVGKALRVAPKALIGTDKFTLRKQNVARSNIPELLEKYGVTRSDLETIYQIPTSTAKRIVRGDNLDYKNLHELYMKVFRAHGVGNILDLIVFS